MLQSLFPHEKILGSQAISIGLSGTPFGRGVPPIPTADRLVLSKIASRPSLEPVLQKHHLKLLRDYLATGEVIVKVGDVLPVNVSCDLVRTAGEVRGGDADDKSQRDQYVLSLQPSVLRFEY